MPCTLMAWTRSSTRRVDTPEYVGLGHYRGHGSLRAPARLQQPVRKVAALAQLGNGQLDGPGPGVPLPAPVAVAGVDAIGAALAVLGPALLVGLGRHQRLGDGAQHRVDEVGVGGCEQLAQTVLNLHAGRRGHRFSFWLGGIFQRMTGDPLAWEPHSVRITLRETLHSLTQPGVLVHHLRGL